MCALKIAISSTKIESPINLYGEINFAMFIHIFEHCIIVDFGKAKYLKNVLDERINRETPHSPVTGFTDILIKVIAKNWFPIDETISNKIIGHQTTKI